MQHVVGPYYLLARIAPEDLELKRIKEQIGAADDASARPFLPAYRALVGNVVRPLHLTTARYNRLHKKHPSKRVQKAIA